MTNMDFNTPVPFSPSAPNGNGIKMSSREIAELTNKQHQHVKRDIEKLLTELGEDASKFGHIYFDTMNREQNEYLLDRDHTENLLMGYSAVLRQKVLARLRELEASINKSTVVDFSDPRVVFGVLNHLQGEVAKKDEIIAEQGTRLKKLDRLESAKGSMCVSDAAKTLGVGRDYLFQFLSSRKWTFKRAGNKNWLAYDIIRKAGYLEHDDHLYLDDLGRERISTRVLVTAKGLVKLAELIEQPLH